MRSQLLLFFLLLTGILVAQQTVEDQILQEATANTPSHDVENNQVFIVQSGQDNVVQSSNEGDHRIQVLQSGNNNSATVDLLGSQNQINLLQQGNAHEFQIVLDGNSNRIITEQYGNGNSVRQELQGTANLEMEVLQIGTGHELILFGDESHSQSMRILQQGTPTSIIIEKIDF